MTESTVFRPMHTLGQSPAHGEQFSLDGQTDKFLKNVSGKHVGFKGLFQLAKMFLKVCGHALENAYVEIPFGKQVKKLGHMCLNMAFYSPWQQAHFYLVGSYAISESCNNKPQGVFDNNLAEFQAETKHPILTRQ